MKIIDGYVGLTVQGRPFQVRREHIVSVGIGSRALLDAAGQPLYNEAGEPQYENAEGTLLGIAFLGELLVDQDLNEVTNRIEGIGGGVYLDDGMGAMDR
jgi:hypothetical protein